MQSLRYAQVQDLETPDTNTRDIEEAMLSHAAAKLQDCLTAWDTGEGLQRLQAALKYNQELWSVFQVELGCQEHDMPDSLKRNLLTLSRFIDRRTLEIMAEPEPSKLHVLIDINQHLAAGLRGNAAGPIEEAVAG